jgi:hypothetical protein
MLKKVSIVLVSALLAGVVIVSACKKEGKDNPEADGKAAAKELCKCLEKVSDEDEAEICYEKFRKKYYEKYPDNDVFEIAFEIEIKDCEAHKEW